MSTSLIYHGFGLKNQKYLKTEFKEGKVFFHIQTKENNLRCSQCGSKKVIKRGSKQRKFRGVPIGLKQVIFIAKVQRLECKECGAIQQEELKYADKKKVIPINLNDM
ncbi:MAG: transposase family protein [Bacteroidota bacterium]|nr:transposase family protein [Bacteroidota bacterium]